MAEERGRARGLSPAAVSSMGCYELLCKERGAALTVFKGHGWVLEGAMADGAGEDVS